MAPRRALDVFGYAVVDGGQGAADFDGSWWLMGVEEGPEEAVLELGVEDGHHPETAVPLRSAARAALHRSYRLSCAYRLARVWRKNVPHLWVPPVLVYQMGKVGSTAIYHGLSGATRRPVHHVHFLSHESLRKQSATYQANFARTSHIDRHFLESLYLRARLDRLPRVGGPWTIITLVRDPLAKNVSSFFQTLEYNHPDLAMRMNSAADAGLADDIRARFFTKGWWHDDPLEWFDRELKQVFGVDVFAREFPREIGWDVYRTSEVEVLLIRAEDVPHRGQEALAALGFEGVQLSRDNVSLDKSYGAHYEQLKRDLALDSEYLERLYGSPRARHFYSTEQLSAFKGRWNLSARPRSEGAVDRRLPG